MLGLGTSVPPHRVSQERVRRFAEQVFGGHRDDLDRLLNVFGTAQVEQRHLALPLEAYLEPAGLASRNRTFIEVARGLCAAAGEAALEDAGLDPGEVTHVVTVTSTGLATPTLETLFGPGLGLGSYVHRIPIWGLGCAGGPAALALAGELARVPGNTVLVVVVELCSLTFVPDDHSKANVVATALFADGAAAAVVGDDGSGGGLLLGNHEESLLPDSRGVMGWDITSRGLQVVFLQHIPALVAATYRDSVVRALAPHGLHMADLECLAVHPGGRRVVEAQEAALDLPAGRFGATREVLRLYGNMSSATVFHVLEETRRRGLWGRPGILSAFGPGFTSHVVVLPGAARGDPTPPGPRT